MNAALKSSLKKAVWDYDISDADLVLVYEGKKEFFSLDQVRLKSRLLLSASWYDLLAAGGESFLKDLLSDDVISNIHYKEIRDKLSSAKEILNA